MRRKQPRHSSAARLSDATPRLLCAGSASSRARASRAAQVRAPHALALHVPAARLPPLTSTAVALARRFEREANDPLRVQVAQGHAVELEQLARRHLQEGRCGPSHATPPPPHSTAPQLSRPHLSSVDAQARSSRLPRDASGRETPSASGTQTRTGSTWSLAVRPPAVCTSCHLNRSLQPWHCFLRRASQVRASTSSRRRRTRRRCPATENRTTTRARRRGCSRKRLTHDSDE